MFVKVSHSFSKKLISEDCFVVDDFRTRFEGLFPILLLAKCQEEKKEEDDHHFVMS